MLLDTAKQTAVMAIAFGGEEVQSLGRILARDAQREGMFPSAKG
jgi:hypothetical protein